MDFPRLTGLVAAVHSPFAPDGSLDLAAVEQQADHLVRNRVATAFIAGSTGESHSLTADERRLLTQRWVEVARDRPLDVIVHVGSNCLADARMLAAHAQALGARAVAAISPSYFKPASLDALVDTCAEIAGAAPQTPFYYYDIPSMTDVQFAMHEFLARARTRVPNLAGLKFTNADLMVYQLCLRAEGGAFDVLWGRDEYLLAALALGARGAVGSTYNFAAPVYHRLIDRFEAGDLAAAREEQFRSVRLIELLAGYGFMGAAKAVMNMLGIDVGPPRLPLTRLAADDVLRLGRDLESLGFFDWVQGPSG